MCLFCGVMCGDVRSGPVRFGVVFGFCCGGLCVVLSSVPFRVVLLCVGCVMY